MNAFEEELKELNKEKEGKNRDDKEFIQATMRQTQMFLELAKILENGKIK